MTAAPLTSRVDVDNIYIFISDALRWDSLPERMQKRGALFKTIASGCATIRSVSSIVSGVYPPTHGVQTWRDRITADTLFDIIHHNSGFYNPASGKHDGLSQVLGQPNEDTLPDIEPPFIFLERDQGGHAPYRGYTYDEMIVEVGHDSAKLRSNYTDAVRESIDRFDERLSTLSDRGLLDDTLVVFLSDHGELLGEHGLVSHSSPIVPELVYVPTLFIHSELDSGVRSETIGHVDILPTVLSAIDSLPSHTEFDGVDLFRHRPGVRFNDAGHYKTVRGKRAALYYAASVWDEGGGHVHNELGRLLSPLIGLKKARGWNRAYWKANLTEIPTALSRYAVSHIEYGHPNLSKQNAFEIISTIREKDGRAERGEIDEAVKQQLNDLGYRM